MLTRLTMVSGENVLCTIILTNSCLVPDNDLELYSKIYLRRTSSILIWAILSTDFFVPYRKTVSYCFAASIIQLVKSKARPMILVTA
jgi:hypothetical protein